MTDIILRESLSPDRTRTSVRCREFHDLPNTDLGGSYNCCCCNSCKTIRPNNHNRIFPDQGWCCRCVPRAIYARFEPDDLNDPCCKTGGTPMFFNHEFSSAIAMTYGTYIGTLFGILIRVDLGATNQAAGIYETGTGTEVSQCAWLIRAWDARDPSYPKLFETTIDIDHDTITCIEVPKTVVATGITGPTRCTGSIVLDDIATSRLAFIESSDTAYFDDKRDPRDDPRCQGDGTGTGTGTGEYEYGRASPECQPKFINFCGECRPDYTTLTSISVNGATYPVDDYENDRPTFINGVRKVYWDGANWSLVEASATGTGTPLIYDEEVAIGPPLPDCPLGLWEWSTPATGTGTGTSPGDRTCFCVTDPTDGIPHEMCGCCGQVCSRLCVSHVYVDDELAAQSRRTTFTWFEDWLGDVLTARGWSYYNPATEYVERIFLGETLFIVVDGRDFERDFEAHAFGDPAYPYWRGLYNGQESYVYWSTGVGWALMIAGNEEALGPTDPTSPYGDYTETSHPFYVYPVTSPTGNNNQCSLRYRYGPLIAEIYEAINIDTNRGCSCKLYAEFIAYDHVIEIRCGVCTCWEFYCGTCRCVPTELCVAFYVNHTWYTNTTLTWDESLKSWTGTALEDTGTEVTGTGTLDIAIHLQRDDLGRCILVPQVPGHTFPADFQHTILDCGTEAARRKFINNSWDFINIFFQDYTDPDNPFAMSGGSLTPECGRGPCLEATPCYKECGTHPSTLHATLTQWRVPGDLAIPYDLGETWSVEIILQYTERPGYFTLGDPVETSVVRCLCEYRGYLPAYGDCPPYSVTLLNSHIVFTPIQAVGGPWPSFNLALTESCDPYYGDTGEYGPGLGVEILSYTCIGLTQPTTRYQIIITE